MKRIFGFSCFALFALLAFNACDSSTKPAADIEVDPNDTISAAAKMKKYDYAKLNYALGASAGSFFDAQDIHFDKNEFMRGAMEAVQGSATITPEESQRILQEFFMLKRQYDAEKSLAQSLRFLDSVSKLEGVVEDPSGLLYRIDVEGTGVHPTDSSYVQINYKASFIDGEVFDQSEEGSPVVLGLQQVIRGWVIGIPKMREGGKATLYIPAALAYGEYGRDVVPGNATLIFDVELIKVLTPEDVELYRKGEFR